MNISPSTSRCANSHLEYGFLVGKCVSFLFVLVLLAFVYLLFIWLCSPPGPSADFYGYHSKGPDIIEEK